MQKELKLFRKRYIPDETTYLKDDELLHYEEDLIITKWRTLKPRTDIAHGISAYFIDKGIKVSKIFDSTDKLVYWYCDIIQTIKKPSEDSIIFEDLILDVIVYEDGFVKVMDMDEVADALDQHLMDPSIISYALRTLNNLLLLIYSGDFYKLQNVLK